MIGGITGGSAQPKFNKTDFRNMEIKFPAFDELDKFNAEIDPIYKKYELNIKENEKLSFQIARNKFFSIFISFIISNLDWRMFHYIRRN